MAAFMAGFGEWMQRNPVEKASEIVRKAAQALKKQHSKICVVGFCYGVKPGVEAMKNGDVQTMVAFHPSFVVPEDAPALKGKGAMLWQVRQKIVATVRKVCNDEASRRTAHAFGA